MTTLFKLKNGSYLIADADGGLDQLETISIRKLARVFEGFDQHGRLRFNILSDILFPVSATVALNSDLIEYSRLVTIADKLIQKRYDEALANPGKAFELSGPLVDLA